MSADRERSAVYEAENLVRRLIDRSVDHPTVELAGSVVVIPSERRFGSVESVQNYLDAVLALDWVRARWPGAGPVQVRARRGQRKAHYEADAAVIAVPDHADSVRGTAWAMRELVVLHELSHHLAPKEAPVHGPSFRSRLIELAEQLIAPEAALLLRICYADVGLRG